MHSLVKIDKSAKNFDDFDVMVEYDSKLNLKEVILDLFERDCIKKLNNHGN